MLVTGVEEGSEGNYLVLRRKSIERLVVLENLGREVRGDRDLVVLAQLIRLIRRFRPHIVDTHTAKAGALGRLAALLTGVPVIVHTYHGHVFHGYFSPARTRAYLAIDRWLARRTTCLVTVSARVREELLRLGIGTPDRFVVVPLGLELDRLVGCEGLRGELRAELELGREAPLVGIVARLVPIKAHELFLEAARIVARAMPETRFLIVGDGERRAELGALAERFGLTGRVVFLGWRRDLERIYADLDLVVLTSRNEGSPVSLIEAMAAARPVVATRVGGVPDLVEDQVTGRLVDSGDAEGLARAMLAVLSDPERGTRMGLAGRQCVYPHFTAERLLDRMDRLYTRLLNERVG